MTGTNPTNKAGMKNESNGALKREYENDEPDVVEESSFYVEKATSLIYEVKLFPEFVLVKPVMLDFQPPVTRLDLMAFIEAFEEYVGDSKALRTMLFSGTNEPIVVNRHDRNG